MASESESKPGAAGTRSVLIAAVLTCVVGLGVGFGLAAALLPDMPSAEAKVTPATHADKPADKQHDTPSEASAGHGTNEGEATAEAEPEAEMEVIDPAEIAFAPILPVITNITDPQTVWIRLEGGISYVKTGEKKPEELVADASKYIMGYLRTIALRDVQSMDGINFLTDDLNVSLRALSQGQIRRILITGLVVE